MQNLTKNTKLILIRKYKEIHFKNANVTNNIQSA